LHVGRLSFSFDPHETWGLCAQASGIACDCIDCTNFRGAGEAAFSLRFLQLLRKLGIDPSKAAELFHDGAGGEAMTTQGWFHFVGHLENGADAWREVGEGAHALAPEPFPGIKSSEFTPLCSLVPRGFEGKPLVQLEFETCVPWVSVGSRRIPDLFESDIQGGRLLPPSSRAQKLLRVFWPKASINLILAGLFAASAFWAVLSPNSGCVFDGEPCISMGFWRLSALIGGPVAALAAVVAVGVRFGRHSPRTAVLWVAVPPLFMVGAVVANLIGAGA